MRGLAGYYYDPKHGGCLRRVHDDGRIVGVYGSHETGTPGTVWTAHASAIHGDPIWNLRVDFSGKPLKRNHFLFARFSNHSIRWQDGNEWKKLYVHPQQFR